MRNQNEAKEASCCLSSYQLDGLHLQFLSEEEQKQVEQQIADCASCQELVAQRKSDYTQLEQLPGFEAFLEEGFEKLVSQAPAEEEEQTPAKIPVKETKSPGLLQSFWQWFNVGGMPLAAGVAVLVVLVWFGNDSLEHRAPIPLQRPDIRKPIVEPEKSPPTRGSSIDARHTVKRRKIPKGRELPSSNEPHKRQVKKRPIERMVPKNFFSMRLLSRLPGQAFSNVTKDGATLPPGTLIQFDLKVYKDCHLLIASINEKKEVTVFVPLGGKKSIAIKKGSKILPSNDALELDEQGLGLERIFVVVAPKPLTAKALKSALLQSYKKVKGDLKQMLHLPGWYGQTLLIQKKKLK